MAARRLVDVFLILSLLAVAPVYAQVAGQPFLIDIEGGIGPATADHMIRGLEQAHENNAAFVILRIDTPGGLDTSMRDMIKAILAANFPVIGFVSPSGARAASAGTYILYTTHIAAMAPGTNIGAATPVQIGAPSMPELPGRSPDREGSPGHKPVTAMERKVVNDAVAYIRSLAQMRGRNGDWAELAVREGASLTAADALADNVIDLMAESVEDLLPQLHGRQVSIYGAVHTLDTQEQSLFIHEIDWRSEFLSVITDPNVAYMLMLIGIYGMIFEFYSPGVGVPGVVGAVCLLVALYAFQVLPISYAGLALMLLGIGLMTAEALSPTFGILGLGGIVSFVIGSIILMDTELPGYQIALPMIFAFATFSAGILIFAIGMVVRARKQAVVSGLDHLLGAMAVVETVRAGSARVRLDGELWQVNCEDSLNEDDAVTITAINGITLDVTKENGGRGS